MEYILENEFLCAVFNGRGAFISLENRADAKGNIITTPDEDGFLVNFAVPDECFENICRGRYQTVRTEMSYDGMSVSFICDSLTYSNGRADDNVIGIKAVFTVLLSGEKLIFKETIDNPTDVMINDVEFPRVGLIRSLGGDGLSLFNPEQAGVCYTNVGERVNGDVSRESAANKISNTYPARMSMQWMALSDNESTLFFSGRDDTFSTTEYRCEGSRKGTGTVTLVRDMLASVNPHETKELPPLYLSLYKGDWHRGAREYAEWFAPLCPSHRVPGWVRNMQGYYLVINKQQYGYEMWPYDSLLKLYELAVSHGCDTLGLFGWYATGHDNKYPDLEVSDTMGGAEALKKNIKEVQAKGGHVTLYFQGHLIDPSSDFYKNGGDKLVTRSIWGSEYVEYYTKSHESGFMRLFSDKRFAVACPSCREWRELMVKKCDWLAGFGPDGVLYDQLGGLRPYICFDKNHEHDGDSPARSQSGGRRRLLDEIETHTKEISPEFAFFSEHITDVYSRYLDALHGIHSAPGAEDERAKASTSKKSACLAYPELFRYTFPDKIITVRNQHPYISPRMVNYAFLYSFVFEIELRYRRDKDEVLSDEFGEWREYAKKVADLRKRFWHILGNGSFSDALYAVSENPHILAKCYEDADEVAVALWNDSGEEQKIILTLKDNLKLTGIYTVTGDFISLDALPAQSAALAVYKKI